MPEPPAQGTYAKIALEKVIVIQSEEWILSELPASRKLSSFHKGIIPGIAITRR
jgi:hypothetical protein